MQKIFMNLTRYMIIVTLCVAIAGFLFTPNVFAENDIEQLLIKAKLELRTGISIWDPNIIKKAKNMFLNLLINDKPDNAWLHYYIALCDYNLATYYMGDNKKQETERHTKDAQKYLNKVMELKPSWGEPYALYASTLGYEIALDLSKAMSMGMKIYEYYGKAQELEPQNPRIKMLKGASDLYTPPEYGGGPDVAIKTLTSAVDLFEKEKVETPWEPSWGKEEAYTFLGMAYQQKGDEKTAQELYEKALKINPDFGLAKQALQAIKK